MTDLPERAPRYWAMSLLTDPAVARRGPIWRGESEASVSRSLPASGAGVGGFLSIARDILGSSGAGRGRRAEGGEGGENPGAGALAADDAEEVGGAVEGGNVGGAAGAGGGGRGGAGLGDHAAGNDAAGDEGVDRRVVGGLEALAVGAADAVDVGKKDEGA